MESPIPGTQPDVPDPPSRIQEPRPTGVGCASRDVPSCHPGASPAAIRCLNAALFAAWLLPSFFSLFLPTPPLCIITNPDTLYDRSCFPKRLSSRLDFFPSTAITEITMRLICFLLFPCRWLTRHAFLKSIPCSIVMRSVLLHLDFAPHSFSPRSVVMFQTPSATLVRYVVPRMFAVL
jgi:hypothetical protein